MPRPERQLLEIFAREGNTQHRQTHTPGYAPIVDQAGLLARLHSLIAPSRLPSGISRLHQALQQRGLRRNTPWLAMRSPDFPFHPLRGCARGTCSMPRRVPESPMHGNRSTGRDSWIERLLQRRFQLDRRIAPSSHRLAIGKHRNQVIGLCASTRRERSVHAQKYSAIPVGRQPDRHQSSVHCMAPSIRLSAAELIP